MSCEEKGVVIVHRELGQLVMVSWCLQNFGTYILCWYRVDCIMTYLWFIFILQKAYEVFGNDEGLSYSIDPDRYFHYCSQCFLSPFTIWCLFICISPLSLQCWKFYRLICSKTLMIDWVNPMGLVLSISMFPNMFSPLFLQCWKFYGWISSKAMMLISSVIYTLLRSFIFLKGIGDTFATMEISK